MPDTAGVSKQPPHHRHGVIDINEITFLLVVGNVASV
jgi:hypothetical protein